jgi:mannosyltransferase OCH1-like enzyme
MVIPKIMHQTARSKTLAWEEERLARRLRRLLPGWTYRLWDDDDNSRLIATHFPQYAERYERISFGVAKADIARYAYLAIEGGFYFDTDYRLLKTIDDRVLRERCIIPIENVRPPGDGADPTSIELGNAIMASAPGHPFWAALIEFIFERNRPELIRDQRHIVPGTGPGAVTDFYHEHRAEYPDVAVPSKNAFQPDIACFAFRTSADRDTYGVHLHWGSWRGRSPGVAARIFLRRKLNGLFS